VSGAHLVIGLLHGSVEPPRGKNLRKGVLPSGTFCAGDMQGSECVLSGILMVIIELFSYCLLCIVFHVLQVALG
jgi:hypothetical protein